MAATRSFTEKRFLEEEVFGDFRVLEMFGETLILMPLGGAGGGMPIPGRAMSTAAPEAELLFGLNHMASSSSLMFGASGRSSSLPFLSFFFRNIGTQGVTRRAEKRCQTRPISFATHAPLFYNISTWKLQYSSFQVIETFVLLLMLCCYPLANAIPTVQRSDTNSIITVESINTRLPTYSSICQHHLSQRLVQDR